MPDTMTLNKVVQIGVESTPGTTVAATKKLQLITLDTVSELDIQTFDGQGRRFDVASAINRDYTTLKLGGKLNFTEIVYIISSMFGAATITTPTGATLGRNWKWQVPLSGSITPKTLTIEEGDAVQAHKMGYYHTTDLEMKFSREGECSIGGAGIAQVTTDGITLTAALSPVDQIPVLGKHVNWYLDNAFGSLGSTKYLRVFDSGFKWGKAFSQLWPMDRANASYAAHVDASPNTEISLMVEMDSQGIGLRADARANTTKYLRIECIGDQFETGTPNQFWTMTVDLPIRFTKFSGAQDKNGVQVGTFTAEVIEDASMGFGANINVENKQAAL